VTPANDALPRDERTLTQFDRDEEGFLFDGHDWLRELIDAFAAEDELKVLLERREIIAHIRSYFEKKLSAPEARTLLKHLHTVWGKEKASRRYLYQLFPRGSAQQACKVAGMRKLRKLMLGV